MTTPSANGGSTDDSVDRLWDSLHISRSYLGRLAPFDSGGEGTIYRVGGLNGPYDRRMLYKEYRPETLKALDEAALERFPSFRRSANDHTLGWLYRRLAWPAWIVDGPGPDHGPVRSLGVLMPIARPRFMMELRKSAGGRRMVPAKVELLLNGDEFLKSIGLRVTRRDRLQLLQTVADTVAFLHSHRIAVGDFSCKNILFSLGAKPECFFIDCDSMSWDGTSALPPGETPEWEVPKGEPLATTASDVYKFALLALRMYTGAQHHRSPTRLPDATAPALRDLIERSLRSAPEDRPLITEWAGPLRDAALAEPEPDPIEERRVSRVPIHAPSDLVRIAVPQPALARSRGSRPLTLPSGPAGQILTGLLRRLLIRRPASPSPRKLVAMIAGLWAACGAVFGLAVALGLRVSHMGASADVLLFGSFVVLAVGAFALATTEPA